MPKSTFQKPIEIKISTVVAVSAIMYTSDLVALDAAMHEMTGGVSDFFEGDLAVIDVGDLAPGCERIDWAETIALLKKYRLNPVASSTSETPPVISCMAASRATRSLVYMMADTATTVEILISIGF